MREDSHLDDMRSAIRGDFERLAERRGGQDLMRTAPKEPATDPPAEELHPVEPEPEPELEVELSEEPEEAIEPEAEPEEPPVAETSAAVEPEEIAPDEPRKRSWWDKLLGR